MSDLTGTWVLREGLRVAHYVIAAYESQSGGTHDVASTACGFIFRGVVPEAQPEHRRCKICQRKSSKVALVKVLVHRGTDTP